MHVPDVLPLGELVGRIEVTPQAWKVDAGRQRRVAEQVAAAVGVVLAGVLEIHRKRRLAGEDEAAHVGGLLVPLRLG